MSTKRKLLVALSVFLLVFGGLFFWIWRGTPAKYTVEELSGRDPVLAKPKPEQIPSIAIASPIGWQANEAPVAAKGLTVTRFAEGLDHPRVIYTLPNGDVIAALADAPKGAMGSGIMASVANWLMQSAGAHGKSADALVLLRDTDGNGTADQKHTLRQGNGLVSPSGLAWRDDVLYVANHDMVQAFPYKLGETALNAAPSKVMDLPGGGNHWMRNIVLSADGKRLYAAVGSSSNIAENGMEIEKGRAAIWEKTFGSKGYPRQYANGLRNPNGLAWNPRTGELWVTVNERDMLGPDLVPDYLTSVPLGSHYGWPFVWWKVFDDDRVVAAPPDYFDDYVRKPEFALGAHTASLGLVFVTGGQRMGPQFASGAFIARHGSWNRTPPSGYDVVFVTFDQFGNPQGKPIPVLTGFLTTDGDTHGRPTWLAWSKEGALLVSDDTAGIIWRVIDPAAAPSAQVKPLVTGRLPAQRSLTGDPDARYTAKMKDETLVKQR
ncbi:MAG: PQQ-dependent sugar dehydrogenase [Novosphingobium sp.]|uniref:PQQ-dependent sugar dehydrogenase n=1 Tax=Novosphingobium sp. TaxID=1874826 RepID=UPI0032BEF027